MDPTFKIYLSAAGKGCKDRAQMALPLSDMWSCETILLAEDEAAARSIQHGVSKEAFDGYNRSGSENAPTR